MVSRLPESRGLTAENQGDGATGRDAAVALAHRVRTTPAGPPPDFPVADRSLTPRRQPCRT